MGGAFYQGFEGAELAFSHIKKELDSLYQVGIETDPSQRDGKAHKVELSVTRPGVKLRSRGVAVSPSAAPDDERLLLLLYQPSNVTDLPLSVATYAMRGDQPGALKLLVSVDVGAGGSVPRPIRWGTTLVSGDRVVASAKQTIETAADAPSGDTAIVTLPPGAYLLRVAALDAFGRGSVFQIPVAAGLKRAGLVEISDLIVGPGNSGKLRPAPRVKVDDGLIAVVQIYADAVTGRVTCAAECRVTS